MADKVRAGRKRPVSQKRVAVVLASLVGTLTLSAGTLLLLENGPSAMGTGPTMAAFQSPTLAGQLEPSVPLQRGAWNYIIIYQSGELSGSSDSLADGLVAGGTESTPTTVRPKANFHFVVDNARSRRGVSDGELETGEVWRSQVAGAPYAGWPDYRYHPSSAYKNAVGICFIGDVNREPVSEAQHKTLIQLVRELQSQLNIPAEQVLFQWDLGPNAGKATAAQQAYAQQIRASLR